MYCNQIEDANHFFLSCPMYTVEREQMIDTIHQQINNIDIKTILYGNESINIEQNQIIFQTVHEYSKNSGRFTNVFSHLMLFVCIDLYSISLDQ